MIPWEDLDSTTVPGDKHPFTLHRRGDEYSIKVEGQELMNSRAHGSEEALAQLACARVSTRVLIGGLGMGFTTRAALNMLGPKVKVVVAELVPAVVRWNKQYLSHLAGEPLKDKRVTVKEVDVAKILRTEISAYDAILLDVDNGPEAFTRKDNDWLYSLPGLAAAYASLRPLGVLGIWSSKGDKAFTKRLGRTGFKVSEHEVRARGSRGGGHHTIWIASRRD